MFGKVLNGHRCVGDVVSWVVTGLLLHGYSLIRDLRSCELVAVERWATRDYVGFQWRLWRGWRRKI